MKKTIIIALREWKVFFFTPFAMVIIPLYLTLCGIFFYAKVDRYLTLANPNDTLQRSAGLNLNAHLLIPFLSNLLNIFIFIVPLITMRTFSEEKKTGTYDLLVSYPVRPWEIIIGKYIGASALVLLLLGLSLLFPAFVLWKADPYLMQVASAYLGLILFIFFYVAVGVIASLLTENQFVAAIISYGIFFSTVLFQWLAYISVAPWDRFFANFLFVSHLDSFNSGLIFLGDIAVYLCVTTVILIGGTWKLRKHFIR
jgi:ABC-2 type transport system permease protein